MNRIPLCLLLAVLATVTSGCKPTIYRAETTLRADGTVHRAIYQLAEETPAAVREASVWQESTYAPRIPHEEWYASIAELPAAQPDKDHPYFAAWGEFPNVDALPEHVLVDAPEGIADGRLQREYQRTDYVLVVEHRWRETLTDVVTLDDMHQARKELAEIVIPFTEKLLQRSLGDEYDVQPLVDWLHNQARPLFFEITDVYFDFRARKVALDEETIVATLEPILKRHGIAIRDERGNLREMDEIMHTHARHVLVEKLRRRDGEPIPDQTITEIMQWLGLEPMPEGVERPQRIDRAAQAVIAEQFGSEAAMNAAFKPLLTRILGIYGSDFGPERVFDYRHEMPGLLVETSGELLAENETRWRFSAAEAYPFGYTMACRSLETNEALQSKLLANPALTDRRARVRYVELVRDNEPLLAVMRICADDGDLRRLRREHQALKEAGAESAAAFGQMIELLKAN